MQVRSHAQKYFLKLEKTGGGAEVPPPRPKKPAAKPYPVSRPRGSSTKSSDTRRKPAKRRWSESISGDDSPVHRQVSCEAGANSTASNTREFGKRLCKTTGELFWSTCAHSCSQRYASCCCLKGHELTFEALSYQAGALLVHLRVLRWQSIHSACSGDHGSAVQC